VGRSVTAGPTTPYPLLSQGGESRRRQGATGFRLALQFFKLFLQTRLPPGKTPSVNKEEHPQRRECHEQICVEHVSPQKSASPEFFGERSLPAALSPAGSVAREGN